MNEVQLFPINNYKNNKKIAALPASRPLKGDPDAYADLMEEMQNQKISPLANAPLNLTYTATTSSTTNIQ